MSNSDGMCGCQPWSACSALQGNEIDVALQLAFLFSQRLTARTLRLHGLKHRPGLQACLATMAITTSHNLKEETSAGCSLSSLGSFLHFDQRGLRDQMWTQCRFDWEEPQENT